MQSEAELRRQQPFSGCPAAEPHHMRRKAEKAGWIYKAFFDDRK